MKNTIRYGFTIHLTSITSLSDKKNFVINISDEEDEIFIAKLKWKFEQEVKLFPNHDRNFNEYLRALAFDFFADCWDKLQKDLSQTFRWFSVEYGIIRGFDVNRRLGIDGEKIDVILTNEN